MVAFDRTDLDFILTQIRMAERGQPPVSDAEATDATFVSRASGSARHVSSHAPIEDVLASIENVGGGGGDDVPIGNASGNGLEGGSGNDNLDGGGGNDQLGGGDGHDPLSAGADRIDGGDASGIGNDAVDGGFSDDIFIDTFGDGHDAIAGGHDFLR